MVQTLRTCQNMVRVEPLPALGYVNLSGTKFLKESLSLQQSKIAYTSLRQEGRFIWTRLKSVDCSATGPHLDPERSKGRLPEDY